VLTKSKGVLVASTLALAAAGGTVAVIRVASAGPENVASAGLPVPIGSVATAPVPSGAGAASADDAGATGTQATAGTSAPGTPAPGTATGTARGSGQAGLGLIGGPTASGQARRAPAVAAAAGQGEQGPLPAGALPGDGAVPGALASVRALAASRSATTALPHSPRLLNQLAGSAGWSGKDAAPKPGNSAVTASASTTATATATGTGPQAAGVSTVRTSATRASGTDTPTAPAVSAASSPVASPAAASAMPGIDVAAYQHPVTSQYPHGVPINWMQVATSGYRFAAVKGTEGNYYVNPWVATDVSGAKAAGLDVTPYHFAIPNVSSGQQQAEYAVEYSGYTPGARTLPLMLDIEYDPYVATDGTNECYGLSASGETAWISAFVTTARSLTGQYPIIYTTANWWDACTGGSTAFGDDPMWVAAYGFDTPPMPAGWQDWSFWQYTSGGAVPGVDSQGTTDLDLFNPTAIGLIDPGTMASRPLTRVSVRLATLGALIGEQLTWTAAGLPPGVRIGQNGVLTGVITNARSSLRAVTYQAQVTATNATGASTTATFDWQVAASCPEGHVTFGVCPQK
jgi:GH25 family lysozyme M1 (1,4-beta-N-acetylmuramidase)